MTQKSHVPDTQEKTEPDQPKPLSHVLREQIQSGLKSHRRSNLALWLSSAGAGLEIGFSMLLMSVLYTLYSDILSPSNLHLLLAAAYPLGFILVIIGRSELFTEQTALAVIPVLSGNADVKSLLRLWGIVYSGNVLGGILFSLLIYYLGPQMEIASLDSYAAIGSKLIRINWHLILLGGVLAGWLMGLLGWLITCAQGTYSRIFIVIIITFVIGICNLHHCVIGNIEVFTGMLGSEAIALPDYLKFQVNATLGNIIGGVFFVSLLKYSHVAASR